MHARSIRSPASRIPIEPSPFDGLSVLLARIGGVLEPCGLRLPDGLSMADWLEIGAALAGADSALQWARADWWNYGLFRHGARKAMCEAPDWPGPAYQTLANAAWVGKRFDQSSRYRELSFTHHAEVAALHPLDAKALLDWAMETVAETGRRRSADALRAERWRRYHDATAEMEARPLIPAMLSARTADVVESLPTTMSVQVVSASSPSRTREPPVEVVGNVIPFLQAQENGDDAEIARMEALANDILATRPISERLRSRLARIRSFLRSD
jgi:hypothetical protein